jgi:hypothetical protein
MASTSDCGSAAPEPMRIRLPAGTRRMASSASVSFGATSFFQVLSVM